jgi:RND family efflux transporter MFP subunit
MRRLAEICLLVVIATGVAACKKKQAELPPAQGKGAAPMPSLPTVEPIGKTDDTTTVAPTEGRTTGTTFPRAEAQVAARASGIIERIFVKEGDKVRRGMTLFRQDTSDANLRVQQAQAALAAAQVQLRTAETELNRSKSMFDQKAATGMQMDQAQAAADGARVGVQQAEVALNMARKMLADASMRSPIDGVVTAKLKNEGEMATMMPPTIVLVVQDQSVLELRFRLPERSLAEMKVGETVTAKFEALGATTPAKVTRITPMVDPRTRTVEVVAAVPNPEGTLKSGLLAEVELGAAGERAEAEPAEEAAPRAGRQAPKPDSKVR